MRAWRVVCSLGILVCLAAACGGRAVYEDAEARCGDGKLDPGETCDSSDLGGVTCEDLDLGPGTLACSDSCQLDPRGCAPLPGCGNGVLEEGESCDEGEDNSDEPNADCRPDCLLRRCGDGILDDLSEQCDDENAVSDDGCSASCVRELENCGDGVVDPIEECDDANLEDHDGCSSECIEEELGWLLVPTAANPPERHNFAMAYDIVRQRVVVFGGVLDVDAYNDTWEYDGTTWTEVITPEAPTPRSGPAMVYDGSRGSVVLFGGGDGSPGGPFAETWEYDGSTWVQLSTFGAPPGRIFHDMAYDKMRGRVVLFGGLGDSSQLYSDTWELDGSSWTEIMTAQAPASRMAAEMAYDGQRGRIVLFGGYDFHDTPTCFRDTWEYNGSDWVEIALAVSPSGRLDHAMAYNEAYGRIVLFGGSDLNNFYNDTWEYDGTSWVQLLTTIGPEPRGGNEMVYDVNRHRVVIFGGGVPFFTDTWEYGYLF